MPKKKKEIRYVMNYNDDCKSFVENEAFKNGVTAEIKRLKPKKLCGIFMYFLGDIDAYKVLALKVRKFIYFISVDRISVNECSEQVLRMQDKTGGNGFF